MQDLFHIVQVNHALNDGKKNLYLLLTSEMLLFLMELIKKTAIFKIFSDESVLAGSNAHSHVEDYVWMLQIRNYLQLLHEILLMPVLSCL